jgi:hypothetical protein
MLLLPLCLMAAALVLNEARRLTGAPANWVTVVLALVFSASALGFLGVLFLTVDMLAVAGEAKAAIRAEIAAHPTQITVLLAVFGMIFGFVGAGRAAGRIVNADPNGPLVSVTAPVLLAGLGGVMVLAALLRG